MPWVNHSSPPPPLFGFRYYSRPGAFGGPNWLAARLAFNHPFRLPAEEHLVNMEPARQGGNKPPEVLKDKDGYPTEEALDYIRNFPLEAVIERPQALMDFVKSIWEFPDWGWKETPRKNMLGNPVIKYYISTGGWSGNESIISALRGHIFWSLYWESSRTGGHFTFEVKKPVKGAKANKKSGKGKPVKARQTRK